MKRNFILEKFFTKNGSVENTIGLGSIRKALTKSDVQNFFRDRISQFGRELVAAVIPQIPDGTPGKRELQNWNGGFYLFFFIKLIPKYRYISR